MPAVTEYITLLLEDKSEVDSPCNGPANNDSTLPQFEDVREENSEHKIENFPRDSFQLSLHLSQMSDLYYEHYIKRDSNSSRVLSVKYTLAVQVVRMINIDLSTLSRKDLLSFRGMTPKIVESILSFFKGDNTKEKEKISNSFNYDVPNVNLLLYLRNRLMFGPQYAVYEFAKDQIIKYGKPILDSTTLSNVVTPTIYGLLPRRTDKIESFFERERKKYSVAPDETKNIDLVTFLEIYYKTLYLQGKIDLCNSITLCRQALKYADRVTSVTNFLLNIPSERRKGLLPYVKEFFDKKNSLVTGRLLKEVRHECSDYLLNIFWEHISVAYSDTFKRYSKRAVEERTKTRITEHLSIDKTYTVRGNI